MNGMERRVAAAALFGAAVTGLECGVGPSPIANLVAGLLIGVPAAVAALGVLTVLHHVVGERP